MSRVVGPSRREDMEAIFWLTLTIGATALMWVPYVLNAMAVRGPITTLGYREDVPDLSPWAIRAKRAHSNAIENLALFAASVVAYYVIKEGDVHTTVVTATMVYFISRVAHYIVYAAKIPVARTLTFFGGWSAQLYVIYMLILTTQSS